MARDSLDIELHELPLDIALGGRSIHLRSLERGDEHALLDFGRRQPDNDLLFLERDITDAGEVAAWVADTDAGRVQSFVAFDDAQMLGYATIERGHLRWTRHVAEIRVMVDISARRLGLGHVLLGIAFEGALAADVSKIVAQMTPIQIGARKLFEGLGFEEDAVLSKHVEAKDGERHDLVVMRFDTTQRQVCEGCGEAVLTLIPLSGRQLCWSCYELEDVELGAG